MARTPSTMLALGTTAPDFSLPEPLTGRTVSLAQFTGQPLLVVFSCNHCPFVKLIHDAFVALVREYRPHGLACVVINANDVANYPDDAPDKMAALMRELGVPYLYLYDETQDVAQAYQAACTPDFFLFDAEHKLVYRGQFDDARPGNGVEPSGADLRAAIDAVLRGERPSEAQKPSLGCNIKWREGNAPTYYAT